jgi:hypothetical protein
MPTVRHHIAVLGVVVINGATWYAVRTHKPVSWFLVSGPLLHILVRGRAGIPGTI